MHVVGRILIPGLWRLYQSVYPPILPPSCGRDVFSTIQMAYLVRNRLHYRIHRGILHHTSGQLHSHRGLLDGLRLQIRLDRRLHLHGYFSHQHHGRRVRSNQRCLRRGTTMHSDLATIISSQETKDCPIRNLLPRPCRCRRQWRTNLLANP